MDQQPKIPTLKDAQKPQVKIKGMGAGLTLFDRLKQFKKKDLAFILAGLGTLFMAPLAEHFMMAPENGDASLQQGWGKGGSGGGNFFGSGSSPYESGNSLASGGAIGGSGDIITPLNVRDPSSLVMGPGGTQQPPAGSAAPAAPPPTAPASNETDYRDALKGAAANAARAAVKKAPLPVPKVALGGSGLRGLGVAGGGSSASGSSLPIGPAAGSLGGPGGGGMRLVRATPGFKGVAGGRSPTGGTGLDGTKKAGANAGDAFNRAGSAAAGLNAAASETIPTGGQGFGGGGQGGSGANDKPGSGTGPGGSKSVGESLAFLRAKQRQEEEMKLEFEKRKLKDPELLLYGIRNDSLKAMASEVTKSLTKHITGFLDPSPGGSASVIKCPGMPDVPAASARKCEKPEDFACFAVSGNNYSWIATRGSNGLACQVSGAPSSGAAPSAENPASTGPGRFGEGGAATVGKLKEVCAQVDTLLKDPTNVTLGDGYLKNLRVSATRLSVMRDSMVGKTQDCATIRTGEAGDLDGLGKPVADSQTAAFDAADALTKTMVTDVNSPQVKDYRDKLLTNNDGPTKLAEESRAALAKVEAYAKDKGLEAAPALGTPPPDLLAFSENKKKLEDIHKTLTDSQIALKTYLGRLQSAQQKLDGKTASGDGGPAASGAEPPILTDLGEIAVDPGSLIKVQDANVAYEAKKADIEKALEGTTVNATSIEKKAQPIVTAAGDAKTKTDAVPAKVPEKKIKDENGAEVDNPAYADYVEKAKEAKTAVVSVRAAQAGWLVTVQNTGTTAKSSLTGAPTQ